MGGSGMVENPIPKAQEFPLQIDQGLTFPDLSKVKSTYLWADNNSFVGCSQELIVLKVIRAADIGHKLGYGILQIGLI